MTITLTNTQQVIFDDAMKFARQNDDEHFVVAGLAGAGKTTVLVEIVRGLMEMGLRPAVCTPTGKAAHVINSKQKIFTATTLHRTLTTRPVAETDVILKKLMALEMKKREEGWTAQDKKDYQLLLNRLDEIRMKRKEGLAFEPIPLETFEELYDILVFDETSMLGRQSHMPLISRIPCKKLFFGDGAQLPPVNDKPAIDLKRPNHRLTEILRQADGSGIIPLSHHITKRNDYLPVREIKRFNDITLIDDNVPETIRGYEQEHQILVWRNEERHKIARMVRERRGFDFKKNPFGYEYLPMPGEQLMIDDNDTDLNLMKGQMVTVVKVHNYLPHINPFIVHLDCIDENDNTRCFKISLADLMGLTFLDKRRFTTNYKVPYIEKMDADRVKKLSWIAVKSAVCVMFPYSLTCHKAQGSEWDKVFVLNTHFRGNDWPKWTYTAVTRAAKELVIADYTFKHG